jgi:hypothetical protein
MAEIGNDEKARAKSLRFSRAKPLPPPSQEDFEPVRLCQ